jgi:hypothetical protein
MPAGVALPRREAESQHAEADPVAGADDDRTVDAPTVEAGPVLRPEIREEPLPTLSVQLGVEARDREVMKNQVAPFRTADREPRVIDRGEPQPRQARFPPGGLEPDRERGHGEDGVGQSTCDTPLWWLVVDQRGELAAAPGTKGAIDTPYKRVERDVSLD